MLVSIEQSIEVFVEAGKSAGWRVDRRDKAKAVEVPGEISERYGSLPPSYQAFLREIARASSEDEGVWFLCEREFWRADPNSFTWNEIEKMALESATDPAQRQRIASFWDQHLPIMMAPNGDYDFLAIALPESAQGAVVHGYACHSPPSWGQRSPGPRDQAKRSSDRSLDATT